VNILEMGFFLSTSVPVFVWGASGQAACMGLMLVGQMVSVAAVRPVSRDVPGLGLSVLVLSLVSFCFSRNEEP
jgi:hypothetical protein